METRSFVIVFFVLFVINISAGAKINNDGGYDITVAIQETGDAGNSYLQNLQVRVLVISNRFLSGRLIMSQIQNTGFTEAVSLQRFSIQLATSSNNRFYIKSVEVLVPPTWNDVQTETIATSQSYATADIRVSVLNNYPYTENPNLCGTSGSHIELPFNFFNSTTQSKFGNPAKALLTQWARYRWGVWDEHGYPSSTKFPYFNRNRALDQWELTGCSNLPLIGKYVDRYGEVREHCNLENGQPAEECRFQPAYGKNNATTSIMHFQFIDSVDGFCDKATHNHLAPNKQNLFCGYKSIWEVIRTTTDYKVVTNQRTSIPPPRFTYVKEHQKTVLYVLADKATPQFPNQARKVFEQIVKLFDEPSIANTVTSLGTFPNPVSNAGLIERVGWSTISANKAAFQNAIETPGTGIQNRNFGLAILDAAELLKLKNPTAGSALLVIKIGAGSGSFGNLTYEKDVFASLVNQKIKVFALELHGERTRPNPNLELLVQSVGGVYSFVTPSTAENEATYRNLITQIAIALQNPLPEITQASSVIFKGIVPVPLSTSRQSIIIKPGLQELYFYMTVPENSDVLAVAGDGSSIGPTLLEWNEIVDENRRKVLNGQIYLTANEQINGGQKDIRIICEANCGQGHLFVLGIYNKTLVNPGIDEPQVTLFTSAIDNMVDLNVTKEMNSPFTIYARVQRNNRPIAELNVEALITSLDNILSTSKITLVDNGLGSPDISSNDGIYSGTFVPNVDGLYKISIVLKNEQINLETKVDRIDLRLIPENQNDFGCLDESNPTCGAQRLDKLYQSTFDLPKAVGFINRQTFTPGKPTKIVDVNVTEDSYNSQIVLEFITPSFVGQDEIDVTKIKYNVSIAQDMSHIIDFRTNTTLVEQIRVDGTEKQPGELERLTIQPKIFTNGLIWVGTVTFYDLWQSELSEVVQTNITEGTSPEPTSPVPTTTLEPESTISPEPTTDDGVTDNPTSQPTQSPNQSEGDEKSFWKKTEGIVTIIAIVIGCLAIVGLGYWFCQRASYSKGRYSTSREHLSNSNLN